MAPTADDPLRASLEPWIGQPLSRSGPAVAPDPVNVPMIRHWVDALDDHNPIHLDEAVARASRFGGLVAPPAMLQTWTMGRPKLEGIAERGGSAAEVDPDSPFSALARAGLPGTLATDSELEFVRYLRPGDRLVSTSILESISERKTTALGTGYFVTWMTTYHANGEEIVGRQRFRIFKFAPGRPDGAGAGGSRTEPGAKAGRRTDAADHSAPPPPVGERLPDFSLAVTTTRIVAGAIASRDFMPVHHDRDYARKQGAPDLFMNILTTNGYVSRYVTDWAGSEARLQAIRIRLGAPATPGTTLRFTGHVEAERAVEGERVLSVRLSASNELGLHASGTVDLSLPEGVR